MQVADLPHLILKETTEIKLMELTEIYVNDQEVAGEYIAQAFFEWNGQEWEMTIKAPTRDEAEKLARSQAEAYLKEWAVNQNAANEKYGVYMF
jgi:hypothetical protein